MSGPARTLNDKVNRSYRDTIDPDKTTVAVTIESGSLGSEETIHVNDSVSGTPTNFPTVATNDLTNVLIRVIAGPLQISFDGGTNYITVDTDQVLTYEPKLITQVTIDGTGSFQALMNRIA